MGDPLYAVGARGLLLGFVARIDEANDDLAVRRRRVFREQVTHLTFGGVERWGEVLGEVGRDLEAVVQVGGEPLGPLGQGEELVLREVDPGRPEVRGQHVEQDQDAANDQ